MAEFKDFLKFVLLTTLFTLQNSSVFGGIVGDIVGDIVGGIVGGVVGGTPTTIDPASYFMQILNNGKFLCAGSLIRPRYVVTAAQCFRNINVPTLTVVGGATRLSDTGIRRNVKEVFTPSGFNRTYMDLDVAVLKLDAPMVGPNIRPISLCSTSWSIGASVKVSGWFQTSENLKLLSNQLRTVEVIAADKLTCALQYLTQIEITDNMLCASKPGLEDSCNGDIGGPAVYNGELCGIVYGGTACPSNSRSSVYTNLSKAREFILAAMTRGNKI